MEKNKQVSSHTPGEQLWEVHRQRKTGIRNVGYAVLMPLITKEGEYNGQIGGYHVIIHQDMNISKEDAQGICDIHNKALEAKADNEKLKADKAVLLEALKNLSNAATMSDIAFHTANVQAKEAIKQTNQ